MELKKLSWSIDTLARRRKKVNTEPDYQRPKIWTKHQKQLLIDSILRGYDIPKIYLNPVDDHHDVVDGQQRITAFLDFLDNKFPLPSNIGEINGIDVSNKKYDELDDDIKDIIGGYNLDVVYITDATEDEIWDNFIRLQNGTPLNAQEKRNAIRGEMRYFIKKVSTHKFFKKVNFKDTRYTYDSLSAKMTLLSLTGKICTVKDKELKRMYIDNKKFNGDSKETKNIFKILNYLDKMFEKKAPELTRYNLISLFILLMDMMPNYALKGREKDLYNWFISFENNRSMDKQKELEQQNPTLIAYQDRISQGSNTAESLEFRNKILKEDLLNKVKDLSLKDPERDFDDVQRQIIYRRDKGICKICGHECDWNEFNADHIVAWNNGGKTCVENGQVLCEHCNKKKQDKFILV